MPLIFDPDKTFDENLAEFYRYLEQLDPECAKIFLEAKQKLLGDGASSQGNLHPLQYGCPGATKSFGPQE